jgi:hypothetical protein
MQKAYQLKASSDQNSGIQIGGGAVF